MDATPAGERTPPPPLSIAAQKRARSSAVEKRPACPATPPSAYARGSWTAPRRISPLMRSVGAIREGERKEEDFLEGEEGENGRKPVSFIPRGAKTCLCAYSSSGSPDTRSTSSPSTSYPTSEYRNFEPGAATRGCLYFLSKISCGV